MAKKYVSAPAPRNIDALLQALLSRVKEEGWDKGYNIDVKALETMLSEYRTRQAKAAALSQAYLLHIKGISQDRAELYRSYMETVLLLRARNRSQPDILRSLDVFKRKCGSHRKKTPAPQPAPEPASPASPASPAAS